MGANNVNYVALERIQIRLSHSPGSWVYPGRTRLAPYPPSLAGDAARRKKDADAR
jgi:hypothetical protein